ncbi:hypothetical protein BDW59DRAFT_4462 [Aspergillus cavernicola]|uniref:F-box domain-containing protein n=1 Tax=Aspergillus cavernicola TaxID=176166 RepID=A0ABR4J5T6_9EURO
MTTHFPLEILSLIFSSVVHDLVNEDNVRGAYRLQLVSRAVRTVVEPLLYRTIEQPSDSRVRLLLRAVMSRPALAGWIREISLEEGESIEGDIESEEDEVEEERDENEDAGSKPEPRPQSKPPGKNSKSETVDAAVEVLKSKFSAHGERIRSCENDWISQLTKPSIAAMKWAFLLQLSNLTSLTLSTRTGEFGQKATLLRLPRLEELSFTIEVGSEGLWRGDIEPEEVLESIISSTDRLKSLTFEAINGSTYCPVIHDAPELKRILDEHAAQTLEYLSIVLGMNDEKDWRMEQECTEIEGSFGSVKDFVKLKELSIQLEVLLGDPSDGLQLKDALPLQLRDFTGLALPDYHGEEDSDRIWEEGDYIPQFEELARAAEDGRRFTSLQSVNMYLSRKDSFNSARGGHYEGGILGQSRINFGWF